MTCAPGRVDWERRGQCAHRVDGGNERSEASSGDCCNYCTLSCNVQIPRRTYAVSLAGVKIISTTTHHTKP